jgi:uncharacterized membrane protein YeaQ/YmgE (transglycosylase-associated protein family)
MNITFRHIVNTVVLLPLTAYGLYCAHFVLFAEAGIIFPSKLQETPKNSFGTIAILIFGIVGAVALGTLYKSNPSITLFEKKKKIAQAKVVNQ